MIVSRPRVGREHLTYPTPIPGIQRIDMMKILGVSLSNTFSFNAHIDIALRQAAQSMYALRVLRSHSLTGEALWDVTRATTLARMLYASPAWWGCADMGHRQRLQNFISKLQRLGFLLRKSPSFADMCGTADEILFASVLRNEYHVLAQLVPPIKETPYQLRPRAHNRSLPLANTLMRKNFVYTHVVQRLLLNYISSFCHHYSRFHLSIWLRHVFSTLYLHISDFLYSL